MQPKLHLYNVCVMLLCPMDEGRTIDRLELYSSRRSPLPCSIAGEGGEREGREGAVTVQQPAREHEQQRVGERGEQAARQRAHALVAVPHEPVHTRCQLPAYIYTQGLSSST